MKVWKNESLLLSIHSFPGANEALQRHWPRFQNVCADEIWIIGTLGGGTWHPAGVTIYEIGVNSYIDSEHLPNRLLGTIEKMLETTKHRWLMIAEYDVLFLAPIQLNEAKQPVVACHTGTHQICKYFHPPWALEREFAQAFVKMGRHIVSTGACGYNTAQSSPDVFFGLVCQELGQEVQSDLWSQFSRNSFDIPGDLDLARDAYRNGVDVIHGCKSESELNYIIG